METCGWIEVEARTYILSTSPRRDWHIRTPPSPPLTSLESDTRPAWGTCLRPSGFCGLHWGSLGTMALPAMYTALHHSTLAGSGLRAIGEFRPSPFISSKQSTTGSSLCGDHAADGPPLLSTAAMGRPTRSVYIVLTSEQTRSRHPVPRLLQLNPSSLSQAR